jgi:glutathione-regulated potassium-efflux system ancillary protein KefC/glutathione-regulated potassium-efflux system protein KefB
MTLLSEAAVLLGAATLAVPLFRRLGLGAVLGYLGAGVLIGPSVLGLVSDVETILHFSEIGVVFLLFIIGLELQPSRLWVLRRSVFGVGATQVLATGLVLSLFARWAGLAWGPAIVCGYVLSLSSTAFVLQLLAENRTLTSGYGRAAFGVLLFQDLAVIPLLAFIPLLAPAGEAVTGGEMARDALLAVAVLATMVAGGRYLLRPVLRFIAATGVHEIFTAAALALVLGAGILMQSVGLSMALGAFIAGVLVADSEYRHQLEADIEPFKGLLLGLFFMAVGMSANLALLVHEPLVVAGLVAGLIAVKVAVLALVARAYGLPRETATPLAFVLAQGGEFAFVLFGVAVGSGVLAGQLGERLVLVVTLSMVITPLLYAGGRRLAGTGEARPFDTVEEGDHDVVIVGFGRFGQIVGRLLASRGIPFTALEPSATQVDFVRRFGNRVYYGDPTRLEVLRAAHVGKAKVLVLALPDVERSVRVARTVADAFPGVKILARARNRQHAHQLMDLGVRYQIRDTLLSSLELAGQLLQTLGLAEADAQHAVEVFRRHDALTLERQYALRHDEEALIQSAKEAAEELRELFESDAGVREPPQGGASEGPEPRPAP